MRADGTVCAVPGYDNATGALYAPTRAFPDIPTAPTPREIHNARYALRESFAEFPFVSEAARSVAIAHLWTLVVQPILHTRPVFLYSAPLAASGKTLLARITNLIAAGCEPALHPFTSGDELRKVLFAALRAGDGSLVFDNVTTGSRVDAEELCRFSTAPTYGDRVLGLSTIQELPVRTTICLTGNNVVPSGELARRSLVARLDTNSASARGRTFKIENLSQHVLERGPAIVTAVLTLVRNYWNAGRPAVAAKKMESFEQWSQYVQHPMIFARFADPAETQETETDEGTDALAAAFAAIYKVFPDEFLHRDLVSAYHSDSSLREALEEAGVKAPDRLGIWLRTQKDIVRRDLKLKDAGKVNGSVRWKLQPMPPRA